MEDFLIARNSVFEQEKCKAMAFKGATNRTSGLPPECDGITERLEPVAPPATKRTFPLL
jgi:hypothetical protein